MAEEEVYYSARDEAWVVGRFGDVGPAPDNEVRPDRYAPPQPEESWPAARHGLAHPK